MAEGAFQISRLRKVFAQDKITCRRLIFVIFSA